MLSDLPGQNSTMTWEEWMRNESGLQKAGCHNEFGK